MVPNEINKSLAFCNCVYRGQFPPFYFLQDYSDIFSDYKVMLITLTPTYQAVTRPITSVRFFRILCLALFGLKPNADNIIEIFLNDKLYWTHYHKCYFDDYWKQKKPLPDHCCEKYLKKEISYIKPELIVILGKETMERINKSIPKHNNEKLLGCDFIYRDFPLTGMEVDFIEVRKKLKKYIPQVDDTPIPENIKAKSNEDSGKLGVHLNFEIRKLEKQLKLIQEKPDYYKDDKDIDERWFTDYLIPSDQRGSFIVNCFSFIEYNIKPLCLEAKIDFEKKHVENLFSEYCSKMGIPKNMEIKVKDISQKISWLRETRNLILHEGSYNFWDSRECYSSIKQSNNIFGQYFFNTLIIKDYECNEALKLVKDIVDLKQSGIFVSRKAGN